MARGRRIKERPRHVSAHRRSRRRPRPSLWVMVSAAISALLISLGMNGTLASWTQAGITNSDNSVATAGAVILQETGASTCTSSDDPSNTYASCSTINKYGGTAIPLTPGASVATTVTFKNLGSANGVTFQLTPGACSQAPPAGSGTPAANNLCTNGDLTVAVRCSPGPTFNAATSWTDLVYSAAAPPTATTVHNAASGDLNAGATWSCQITVGLISGASVLDQGITVSQQLTWTLSSV